MKRTLYVMNHLTCNDLYGHIPLSTTKAATSSSPILTKSTRKYEVCYGTGVFSQTNYSTADVCQLSKIRINKRTLQKQPELWNLNRGDIRQEQHLACCLLLHVKLNNVKRKVRIKWKKLYLSQLNPIQRSLYQRDNPAKHPPFESQTDIATGQLL